MERVRKPLAMWLFVGCSLVLMVVCSVGAWSLRSTILTNQLDVARQRWHDRPFGRYRLVTEEFTGLAPCQQAVEVEGEQVVGVLGNTCSYPAKTTVADLFKQIESYVARPRCGPNGCACDGMLGVDVVYDADLGYPRQLHIHTKQAGRWRYADYWRNLWSNNGQIQCILTGYNGPTITILSLTPVR